MQATKFKKKRSENWLKEDKIILTELIRERVDIIEVKKNDTDSNRRKEAAWEDICESYNYLASIPRDIKQLRVQWKQQKIKLRKNKIQKKKEEHDEYEVMVKGPVESPPSSNNVSVWFNEYDKDSNECDSDSEIQNGICDNSEIQNGIYDNSEVKSEKTAADNETVCRQELLLIQMKNAKLKTETLTLKKELLQLQIESIKKNM